MSEWTFVESNKAYKLCKIHQFGMTRPQPDGDVDFLITVKEYVTPPDPAMRFFAQADRQTNQETLAYTPSGWGSTLLTALAECIRAIEKFPYQGPR